MIDLVQVVLPPPQYPPALSPAALCVLVCFLQKEKIREKFVSVLKEEFKGKGLTFSIGESAVLVAVRKTTNSFRRVL